MMMMERSSLGVQRVPGFNQMVCIHTQHGQSFCKVTSLQQHGYRAEKQNPRNKSGTSTPP